MSHRNSAFLAGNEGFQRLPDMQKTDSTGSSGSARDATISIPLTSVQTNKSGQRKATGMSEKNDTFRIRKGGRRRPGQDLRGNDVEHVNSMGKIYRRILDSSIIVRYFFYIIPIGAILTVPIVVGAVVKNPGPPGIGGIRIVWIFAWGLTMWVALWAAKLFAKTLPYIFEFLCGVVSPGTRKYATIIKALEIPLSLFFWALASLATFRPVLTNNPDPFTFSLPNDDEVAFANNWIDIVTRVLAALLACAGIYLAEKTIIQLISVSYHRMQYDQKIKESKQNVHVLSMLYEASVMQFPAFCPEFREEDRIINDSLDVSTHKKGHARSGSATPLKLIAKAGRLGDRVTAAFGNIAQEVTGKEVFNPTSAHSVVVEALEKTQSQEALAKRIWMSLVAEGREALHQDDLIEVLVHHPTAVAIDAFDTLDNDLNGDVTLDEMIMKVCEIGRSRGSIANSLHDVDQAINVLDNLLLFVVLVICVFVLIAFLNTSFVTTLATAGTALLSLSFVFSVTAQEVLGSCIFLFVKHPFDVGDVIVINNNKLIVQRISLLFTVFKAVASHTTTQCPNIVLNSQWIDNITRSKCMRETLMIDVSFDTTLEDVELFRREMESFVRNSDNSRDFEADIEIELKSIGSMDKLVLGIDIKHKSNWSNGTLTAARRTKFMCALVLALRKVPIYAPGGGGAVLGSADQPTYSVSVSDSEAVKARATFDDAKAAKHIKAAKSPSKSPPTKAPTDLGISTATLDAPQGNIMSRPRGAQLGSASETQALATLTSRDPSQDTNHDWQSSGRTTSIRRPGQPLSPVGEVRSAEIDSAFALKRTSTHGKRRLSGGSRDSGASNLRPPRIDEPMMPVQTYPQYPTRLQSVHTSSTGAQVPTTAQYNPYVQPAPIYEYPPGQAQEKEEKDLPVTPAPPVPAADPATTLPKVPGSEATSRHA